MSAERVRLYYAVRFRLDHEERWLLWHTLDDAEGNEPDGVAVSQSGTLLVFHSQQSLTTYAHAEELLLNDEDPAFFNLDVVVHWLGRKRPVKLDCEAFLNAWNLLADVSASIGGDFDTDKARTQQIYHKLFWGSNISAVTPVGRHFTPVWRGRESRIIREVLREGLAMFRIVGVTKRGQGT